MLIESLSHLLVEQRAIPSHFLKRHLILDVFLPRNTNASKELSLMLINDGQDLEDMPFSVMLNTLLKEGKIGPVLAVGIHAGRDRKNEYGTAGESDYAGRGSKAGLYERFILEELLPFIREAYQVKQFGRVAYCGFSLGGLSAFDTAYHHPSVFHIAGVFSGSLWWRKRSLEDNYDDDRDRIIHQRVRKHQQVPPLKMYFTTGSLDEKADRNNNGIIDSIDDTLDLIAELQSKGHPSADIRYINFEDGKHDVATWGRAMPDFLKWAFGK